MWQNSKFYNSKTQNVTKFTNSNCDKTQKLKLWQISKTQIVKKIIFKLWELQHSNSDKTQTQTVTKLKNSNRDQSQKHKFWQLKNSNCDKTLIIKNLNFLEKKKKWKAQQEKLNQIIFLATIYTSLKCFMNKFIQYKS